MNTFQVGDEVVAACSLFGLNKGTHYVISGMKEEESVWKKQLRHGCIKYFLTDGVTEISLYNLYLYVEKVRNVLMKEVVDNRYEEYSGQVGLQRGDAFQGKLGEMVVVEFGDGMMVCVKTSDIYP